MNPAFLRLAPLPGSNGGCPVRAVLPCCGVSSSLIATWCHPCFPDRMEKFRIYLEGAE